ncbi:hypothetical protein CPB84DRAFT_767784 [Gymnopilus junonius]|uniref:Uncharacterized protein n=1 Tax=Gymnopilus junonius TaxID=109634 RepID=A0A9P5NSF3_GYMJU|nr:hypothetical protein CPB84DRAFT_767784 [Gymnopilus junonius]
MSLSILKRYSNTVTLPFDILLAIIDEIAYTNDVYTMRSCSLLHPALLPHCQKYIFRTFDMRKGTPDPDQYFFKFYTLLTKSPHLARYPYTVYFLRLLTNVEAFGLHFVILTNFKWGNLSLEFQYEIRRIMTRPCFTELTLTGLDYIPRSVINDCRFVKSLSMTACSLECWNPEKAVMATEEDRTMTAIPKKNWVHLESAKFSNCERLFESLYPCSNTRPIHLDFSNLKHLTITLSPDTMEIIRMNSKLLAKPPVQ